MPKPTIGFIGLGDMGEPMAARLLEHGYSVLSCVHRRREAIERLKGKGIIEKADPRQVAGEADVLISIVIDQEQTENALRGAKGALEGMRPGAVLTLMSTLAPTYCQTLADELRSRQIDLLDCPVSGAPMGAQKGTLALIAGGQDQDRVGTTAYHVPEGILMNWSAKSATRESRAPRRAVGTLSVAPAIIASYGLTPPSYMKRPELPL